MTFLDPPEAALAADWKWGCGGHSPPPGSIYLYLLYTYMPISPVSDLFNLEGCSQLIQIISRQQQTRVPNFIRAPGGGLRPRTPISSRPLARPPGGPICPIFSYMFLIFSYIYICLIFSYVAYNIIRGCLTFPNFQMSFLRNKKRLRPRSLSASAGVFVEN